MLQAGLLCLWVFFFTCIWDPMTVLLQANSVLLIVSSTGALPTNSLLAFKWRSKRFCTSALYWLVKASSYWSVHSLIRLSHPSAVFSSRAWASEGEFCTEQQSHQWLIDSGFYKIYSDCSQWQFSLQLENCFQNQESPGFNSAICLAVPTSSHIQVPPQQGVECKPILTTYHILCNLPAIICTLRFTFFSLPLNNNSKGVQSGHLHICCGLTLQAISEIHGDWLKDHLTQVKDVYSGYATQISGTRTQPAYSGQICSSTHLHPQRLSWTFSKSLSGEEDKRVLSIYALCIWNHVQ